VAGFQQAKGRQGKGKARARANIVPERRIVLVCLRLWTPSSTRHILPARPVPSPRLATCSRCHCHCHRHRHRHRHPRRHRHHNAATTFPASLNLASRLGYQLSAPPTLSPRPLPLPLPLTSTLPACVHTVLQNIDPERSATRDAVIVDHASSPSPAQTLVSSQRTTQHRHAHLIESSHTPARHRTR
jgi:hypothetical protein